MYDYCQVCGDSLTTPEEQEKGICLNCELIQLDDAFSKDPQLMDF